MKNFIIIATIFSLLCFLIGIASPQFIFLGIGLAFVVAIVGFIGSLGMLKGLLSFLIVLILPGVIESYGFKWNIPFFQGPVVQHMTLANWKFALDPQIASSVMVIVIVFTGALLLSHELSKLLPGTQLKKLREITIAALLVSLTFVNTVGQFNGLTVLRWFILALALYALMYTFISFRKPQKAFRALPILFYYFIPLYTVLSTANYSIVLLLAIVGVSHLFLHLLRATSLEH